MLIHGTAHCANMYPASEHDVAGLTAARASVTAALKRFLAADKAPAKAPVRKRLLFPPRRVFLLTMRFPLIRKNRSIFIGNVGLFWIYFYGLMGNA